MIRINNIKAPVGYTSDMLWQAAADKLGVGWGDIQSVTLAKRSLDARRKQNIHYILSLDVEVTDEQSVLARCSDSSVRGEPDDQPMEQAAREFTLPPVVVGSGPAGLFAALTLARAGAKPVVLERGFDVDRRKAAVEQFWQGEALKPECNVQFGEGGAGTFSDGKLTTGTKDPRIRQVLRDLVRYGGPEEILYEAKPHIGTDRLAETVKAIRREIIALGGRVEFGARLTDFGIEGGRVSCAVYTQNGHSYTLPTGDLVLATGHSARDVFSLLFDKGVALEQKAFSVGLRIEHLQREIDTAMYGRPGGEDLPPADYKLAVHLPSGRSVYTFCMCPGGVVVAGASEEGGVVTNGMSNHARDGVNANSALLVGVGPEDFGSSHPLAGVEFQREIECGAYRHSDGYAAPAVRLGDFLNRAAPGAFGRVKPSYRPGTVPIQPDAYLPAEVCRALREALPLLGRKIRGFDDPEAVLTGPESRSSSPVRMLRGSDGCSLGLAGLYPCGEGAGYAGGIMSAAVDGIKTAERILG